MKRYFLLLSFKADFHLTFLRYGTGWDFWSREHAHYKKNHDPTLIPSRTVPTKVELSSTFQRYGTGSTRDRSLLANQRRVSLVFID